MTEDLAKVKTSQKVPLDQKKGMKKSTENGKPPYEAKQWTTATKIIFYESFLKCLKLKYQM